MRDDASTRACRESLTSLGDAEFLEIEALYPAVYEDLRQMANRRMRREHDARIMQPTALVNEVYLKLADQRNAEIKSRTHFVAVAAVAMQRILCDGARARKAGKRGGGWERVELEGIESNDEDLRLQEAMAEAIDALAQVDPRKAAVVRLRFLGGLTTVQIAESLGVARSTVDADWAAARAWISEFLAD